MQTNYEVPRVEIPNLTDAQLAQVEAFREYKAWRERTNTAFLKALFSKSTPPFTGKRKPRRKPSANKVYRTKMKARSGYLKAVA